METKRLHSKHWLTGIRGGLGAAVTLAIVVACASGETSVPLPASKSLDPEVQALVTADFSFDRERRHHHCPTPEAISITINRVRVLDAAGVWHVTSTATQTIQLFPVRDLAGPLGLASLAAGSYKGVLLDVVGGTVSLGGNAQSLTSPAHRLFVNGDFTVVAGRVPVFVPDVDPKKIVHCVRDVDCEHQHGHDHGHDDDDHDGDHDGHHDGDHDGHDGHDGYGSHGDHHDGDHDDHHDGDHDDHDYGGGHHGDRDHGGHDYGDRDQRHGHCVCEVNLVWFLRPVVKLLGESADLDGDGVPDAVDNCAATQNAGQQDGDGDGIGDACDGCPSGADSDADGACDAVDNCPSAANPEQQDIDGDGLGDACDTQAPRSSLSPAEEELCVQIFAAALGNAIDGDRTSVLWLQTAFGATRRCRVSLIDYDTLVTHAGTVDLTTHAVTNRTSSGANEGAIGIGRYEKDTARAIAQAAVSGVLAANPGYFPTEQVQVSQGCASGRCVHVLFRLPNGGTTTSIPAEEPAGTFADFTTDRALARVVIDMLSGTVIQTEVF